MRIIGIYRLGSKLSIRVGRLVVHGKVMPKVALCDADSKKGSMLSVVKLVIIMFI